MKNKKLLLGVLVMALAFGMAVVGCSDDPSPPNDQEPYSEDFEVGNLSQNEGSVTAVTIKPKEGKSTGKITIYYETYDGSSGSSISTTLPATVGSYSVYFDVAKAKGWKKATELYAGELIIGNRAPIASDFDIENLSQNEGSVVAVTITPKEDKSSGEITIYYTGIGGTAYAKSTTFPTEAGTYAVTFDVAESDWPAVSGLSAGTLTIGTTIVFTNTAALETWLSGKPYNTPTTPYTIKLDVDSRTLADIKDILDRNYRYVHLDLSGSAITEIPDNAFFYKSIYDQSSSLKGCEFLAGITIPGSITSIGEQAFYYCASLTSVNILNGVTEIGNNAFGNCTGLTSVTIPDSVTRINDYAFGECTGLTSVTISNSITRINNHAFFHCKSLTSVTIPNGVTHIGYQAFDYCTSLASVTIPNSVTNIQGNAFGNGGLTSVTIPDSVTNLGDGDLVFPNCDNLTAINVASGNTMYSSVNGVLYDKDKTTLIQYPKGKTGAFTIPNSVTGIGAKAFQSCTNLTGITIPNSVTSIGWSAFSWCSGLTGVTIPSSVTSIEEGAFQSCSNLTRISIPEGVTIIEKNVFLFCTNLTSVGLHSGVTDIKDSAFGACTSLIGITIPNGVTLIHGWAFSNSGLTKITIPASVTSIGQNAFRNCSSLTSVTFERSTIGFYQDTNAFNGDLCAKYTAGGGGAGTYTTTAPVEDYNAVWTKQEAGNQ